MATAVDESVLHSAVLLPRLCLSAPLRALNPGLQSAPILRSCLTGALQHILMRDDLRSGNGRYLGLRWLCGGGSACVC